MRLASTPGLTLEQEAWALGYDLVRVNGFVVGQRRRADQCGSCGEKRTSAEQENEAALKGMCAHCAGVRAENRGMLR